MYQPLAILQPTVNYLLSLSHWLLLILANNKSISGLNCLLWYFCYPSCYYKELCQDPNLPNQFKDLKFILLDTLELYFLLFFKSQLSLLVAKNSRELTEACKLKSNICNEVIHVTSAQLSGT